MNNVPEFNRIIEIASLPAAGKTFTLDLNADVLEVLAERFGIPKIRSFAGKVTLVPQKQGVNAAGVVSASLVRECVASLEEMEEEVFDEFNLIFDRTVDPATGDPDHEDFDLEAPEYLEGDSLDVADLLLQQLSLAMDPFPRKEGAKSLAELYGTAEETSPFAVLKGGLKGE